MKPVIVLALLCVALATTGCHAPSNPMRNPSAAGAAASPAAATTPPATAPKAAPEVDIHCDTDADCAVKDIGSCCGYYPRCVNKDSPTFAAQVKAQCAREGRAGVCGFPSVSGCQCVAHQCVNQVGTNPGASVQ